MLALFNQHLDQLFVALWAAPACFFVAWLLVVPLCRRVGLVDAPDLARKRQRRPVPLAGGAVVFAALVLFVALRPLLGLVVEAPAGGGPAEPGGPALTGWSWFQALPHPSAWLASVLAWPQALALGLAFTVGLVDDLKAGGLSAGHKICGQLLAAAPLWAAAPGWTGVGAVLAAVAAMNVFNTFDNADRTAAPLGALACLAWSLPLALFLALFTAVNRTPEAEGRGGAYLGDSGSHFVGMLLVVLPGAWLFLLVPALDLARVVVVRLRAGDSPFHGDRRHLAQRLADEGWSTGAVSSAMFALSVPLFVALGVGGGGWLTPAMGAAAGVTTLGFVALTASLMRSRPQPERAEV